MAGSQLRGSDIARGHTGCYVCEATVGRDVTCVRLAFPFQEEKRISSQGRSKELANLAAGGANL